MKILVTGGAGFIGSHLCEKYVSEGHTVICLDNFMSGSITNIFPLLKNRCFKLIKGDIRDPALLSEVVRDVDYVLHLAAQIHVDRSIVEPKLTYDINVLGTLNVLEAARVHDVKKVVYASTSEVYGAAQTAPMNEGHPLDAPHPYGASKIAADRMCHSYIKTYGMDIFIMRSFNIFGPRQKDSGYGGAISIFTRRAINGSPPIIYGTGEQTRDYTYVKDTVNAYDLAVKYGKKIEKPVNFGTGREVKIVDLAKMIIKLAGREGKLKPVHVEGRPGEVERLIADTSEAKKMGWAPRYTLEEGLKEYVEWYRNYKTEEWAKPG